ncbi:proteasome assembly chaperone 3-like [Montipora foliosa]|uniref:proteasome assembly chaperone 3-like n=1 Tax=Montipora foliosa TaxID=591990 RepID=UPI0035F1CFED
MAAQFTKTRTRQAAILIDGIHTEVFCCCYQDRIFVIVSQLEKMGNLISVNKLSSSEDASSTGTQTFHTKTLMGSDEEIWHVYAKQIGALVSSSSSKPLLVGIALKKHSPQTLQQILKLLQSNQVW